MKQDTLILLKPDAVERRLERKVLAELAERGVTVTRRKEMRLTPKILRAHYAHIADKPFFPGVVAYMTRGPVVAFVAAGEDAVAVVRELAGATDPLKAAPHTLRFRFGRVTPEGSMENVIHASEKPEDAAVEIRRFFGRERSVWSYLFGWLTRRPQACASTLDR